MKSYLTIDDFKTGIFQVPNLHSEDIQLALQAVIDRYEVDVYRQILGVGITTEVFKDNPDEWAKQLGEYFAPTVKIGFFAYWIRSRAQQLTDGGVVQNTSAIAQNISANELFVETWNTYIDRAKEALSTHQIAIPNTYVIASNLQKINVYGL